MRLLKSILIMVTLVAFCGQAMGDNWSENFPSSNSSSALYYQMGGGRSVPVPPVQNSVSVPIDASGDVGLGFSCGMFNPVTTITNSLNNMSNSVENVPDSIVQNATSAIISFPMYKLAQADPKLYNLLNNNILGAHNQFALRMKSCNAMQSEALKGKNPYNDYITVARNNNMKHMMSFGDGDLNQAMNTANQEQGKNGIPWATPGQPLGQSAGGLGQAPIHVINDTAIAGYNVLLGRNATDTSTPSTSSNNQTLLNYWANPAAAGKWIASVVGDQNVTTCTAASCIKGSTPGTGLLVYVGEEATQINKSLVSLVANPASVNQKNLEAVSAPGQVVSPALLQSIRQMNANEQANTLATLSQNIATTRIVNEALLAINVLQTGSEVPNIHAVGPAQRVLAKKNQLLQQDINHIMYSVNIRRELNSNVMSTIMKYNRGQNAAALSVPRVGNPEVPMQGGAVVKETTQP